MNWKYTYHMITGKKYEFIEKEKLFSPEGTTDDKFICFEQGKKDVYLNKKLILAIEEEKIEVI